MLLRSASYLFKNFISLESRSKSESRRWKDNSWKPKSVEYHGKMFRKIHGPMRYGIQMSFDQIQMTTEQGKGFNMSMTWIVLIHLY